MRLTLESDGGYVTPKRAIKIVAKQLVANAVWEIEWEDIPDIGELDFVRVMEAARKLVPPQPKFNEAITLLEERAAVCDCPACAVKEDT